MNLTREQIIEYAQNYIDNAAKFDFPVEGDLFCFLERSAGQQLNADAKKGWKFGGYGICFGYMLDEDSKPEGKWVWFSYTGLSVFPPMKQVIRIQPPHIVKGEFQNADRTLDIRIRKIQLSGVVSQGESTVPPIESPAENNLPHKSSGSSRTIKGKFPITGNDNVTPPFEAGSPDVEAEKINPKILKFPKR
jgi:hypothetical protein